MGARLVRHGQGPCLALRRPPRLPVRSPAWRVESVIVVPTCVYRFYDAEDRLLYVGVTDAPGTRFADHRRKSWWKLAVRNTIVWHDRRRDALVEEASAIASERPIHNTAGPVPVPTT